MKGLILGGVVSFPAIPRRVQRVCHLPVSNMMQVILEFRFYNKPFTHTPPSPWGKLQLVVQPLGHAQCSAGMSWHGLNQLNCQKFCEVQGNGGIHNYRSPTQKWPDSYKNLFFHQWFSLRQMQSCMQAVNLYSLDWTTTGLDQLLQGFPHAERTSAGPR